LVFSYHGSGFLFQNELPPPCILVCVTSSLWRPFFECPTGFSLTMPLLFRTGLLSFFVLLSQFGRFSLVLNFFGFFSVCLAPGLMECSYFSGCRAVRALDFRLPLGPHGAFLKISAWFSPNPGRSFLCLDPGVKM